MFLYNSSSDYFIGLENIDFTALATSIYFVPLHDTTLYTKSLLYFVYPYHLPTVFSLGVIGKPSYLFMLNIENNDF